MAGRRRPLAPAHQLRVLIAACEGKKLRDHEDLSEATVARLLRLPLGTVKTLARRGLAKLRAELAATAQDPMRSGREG
jgi:hypothetical protein